MAETFMSLWVCCFKLMKSRAWTHVKKIKIAERKFSLSHALRLLTYELAMKEMNHKGKDNLPTRYEKKI